MLPKERRDRGQNDFFRALLDQILDLNHALAKLAWQASIHMLGIKCVFIDVLSEFGKGGFASPQPNPPNAMFGQQKPSLWGRLFAFQRSFLGASVCSRAALGTIHQDPDATYDERPERTWSIASQSTKGRSRSIAPRPIMN